jgi:hypothetical protein
MRVLLSDGPACPETRCPAAHHARISRRPGDAALLPRPAPGEIRLRVTAISHFHAMELSATTHSGPITPPAPIFPQQQWRTLGELKRFHACEGTSSARAISAREVAGSPSSLCDTAAKSESGRCRAAVRRYINPAAPVAEFDSHVPLAETARRIMAVGSHVPQGTQCALSCPGRYTRLRRSPIPERPVGEEDPNRGHTPRQAKEHRGSAVNLVEPSFPSFIPEGLPCSSPAYAVPALASPETRSMGLPSRAKASWKCPAWKRPGDEVSRGPSGDDLRETWRLAWKE